MPPASDAITAKPDAIASATLFGLLSMYAGCIRMADTVCRAAISSAVRVVRLTGADWASTYFFPD